MWSTSTIVAVITAVLSVLGSSGIFLFREWSKAQAERIVAFEAAHKGSLTERLERFAAQLTDAQNQLIAHQSLVGELQVSNRLLTAHLAVLARRNDELARRNEGMQLELDTLRSRVTGNTQAIRGLIDDSHTAAPESPHV